MKTLGIVGSEAAKFTVLTEQTAKNLIYNIIKRYQPDKVVSGACHLGGIDVWAIEMAKYAEVPETEEFPPKHKSWEKGYKPRNIQIAEASDKVVCITVKELPVGYVGMRFPKCYHCNTADHVKSGGCWTMHYAREHGKEWELYVI